MVIDPSDIDRRLLAACEPPEELSAAVVLAAVRGPAAQRRRSRAATFALLAAAAALAGLWLGGHSWSSPTHGPRARTDSRLRLLVIVGHADRDPSAQTLISHGGGAP